MKKIFIAVSLVLFLVVGLLAIHNDANAASCVKAAPTVNIAPKTKQAAAGQTVAYFISVTDNDSSACGASSYKFTLTGLPTGWTYSVPDVGAGIFSYNQNPVGVVPGRTGSIEFDVTSPKTAPLGANNLTFTAPGLPTLSAQYEVISSSICSVAKATVVPTPSPYLWPTDPGEVFNYSVKVTNNDSAGCPSTTFVVKVGYEVPSSAWTGSSTTLTLAPGTTTTTNITLKSPSSFNSANTSFYFNILATDSNNYYHNGAGIAFYAMVPVSPRITSPDDGTFYDLKNSTAPLTINAIAKAKIGANITKMEITTEDHGRNLPSPLKTCTNTTSCSVTFTPSDVWKPVYTQSKHSVEVKAYDNLGNYQNHTINIVTDKTPSLYNSACQENYYIESISPVTQTGKPGQTLVYNAIVVNSSTPDCGTAAQTGQLSQMNLPGTFTVSSPSFTIAPGEKKTVPLSITSPSTAPNGDNNFVALVTVNGHLVNNSIQGTYVVSNTAIAPASTCTRQTPVVSIFPSDSNTAAAGTGLWYVIRVANGDSAGCGSSTFTLSASSLPSGFTTSNPITITVPTNSIGGTNFLITSPTSATPNTYTFSGTATEVGGAARTVSGGTGTYIVSNPVSTCTRQTPVVSIIPYDTTTAAAGTGLWYLVRIANGDSAGCGSSTYKMSISGLPTGFTTSIPLTYTVPANSIYGSNLLVTSPITAAANTYTFTVTATESGGTGRTANNTGTYTVSGPTNTCVRKAPTATLSSMSPSSVAAGQPITYYVNVTNNDTGNCTPNTRIFNINWTTPPGGWNYGGTSTLSPIASGSSGTAKLTANGSASFANGTYNITVTAGDSISTSNVVTLPYVVSNANACSTPYPTVSLSPNSQAGVAGSTLSYTLTVKNNDTSGCPNTTFSVYANGLNSFTATYPTITLAPGATGTGIVSITSPSSAPAAPTNFTLVVYDNALNNHSATTAGTYIVSATTPKPTTPTNPPATVKITSPTNGSVYDQASGNLQISATTTGTFPKFTFEFDRETMSGTTCNGNICTNSRTTAQVFSGTHTIAAKIFDASNTVIASDSITFSTACYRTAPYINVIPLSQTGAPGQSVTYAVTISNRDVATCGNSTYTIIATGLPSGFTSTSVTATALSPGVSFPAQITVTSPAGAADGVNNFAISVGDGQNSSHSNSAPATYVVSANGNPPPGSTTCTRRIPTLTLSQASQTGTSGQTLSYQVNYTNNDSSACASATFKINTSGLPAGWYANTMNLSGVAPGVSDKTILTITSPVGFANSTNNFSINLTDSSVSSHAISVPATYTVFNTGGPTACSRAVPTLTIPQTTQTGPAGGTVNFSVTIKNNDSPGCANSTFLVNAYSLPNGLTANNPTVTIAPATSGTTQLSITSPAGFAESSKSFVVYVSDPGNAAAHSSVFMGATYVVSNGVASCDRQLPSIDISPASQSGTPGQTAFYIISVKNNDSTSSSCNFNPSVRNFTIYSTNMPPGFDSNMPFNLSIASGGTATRQFTVASPTTAANGTYNFNANATDYYGSKTAQGSYVVTGAVAKSKINTSNLLANPLKALKKKSVAKKPVVKKP